MAAQQPFGDDTDTRMDSSPSHLDTGLGGGGCATPEPKGHHGNAHHNAGVDAYANGLANAHANGHGHAAQLPLGDKDKDKDKDQLGGATPVHDAKVGGLVGWGRGSCGLKRMSPVLKSHPTHNPDVPTP